MDKLFTWDFWKAAFVRVLHTMAQTALGMITVGMAINEVNWLNVLSVSAVAGVISILKSVAVGVPETENNVFQITLDSGAGELDEDCEYDEEQDKLQEPEN